MYLITLYTLNLYVLYFNYISVKPGKKEAKKKSNLKRNDENQFFLFYPHLGTVFSLLLQREEEREVGGEREVERETLIGCLTYMP